MLLTVSGPVNDRIVSRVIRYHPGTGEERALFTGESAHYIPGSGSIAFDSLSFTLQNEWDVTFVLTDYLGPGGTEEGVDVLGW